MRDPRLEQAVLAGVDRRGRAVVVVLEPDRAAGLRLALDRDAVLVRRRVVLGRDDRELGLGGVEDPVGDRRQLALAARPDDRGLEGVAALLELDAPGSAGPRSARRLLDEQGRLGVAHGDVQAERVAVGSPATSCRDVDGHVDGVVVGVRLGRRARSLGASLVGGACVGGGLPTTAPTGRHEARRSRARRRRRTARPRRWRPTGSPKPRAMTPAARPPRTGGGSPRRRSIAAMPGETGRGRGTGRRSGGSGAAERGGAGPDLRGRPPRRESIGLDCRTAARCGPGPGVDAG